MTNALQKVSVRLLDGVVSKETLWAERLTDTRFKLRSVPFYAMNLAEDDIVICENQDGWNQIINVESHSGNGTIRIMFSDTNQPEALVVLNELNSVGCTYERASDKLVALTVPPNLDIPFSQLSNFLNSIDGEVLTGWEIGKHFTRKE